MKLLQFLLVGVLLVSLGCTKNRIEPISLVDEVMLAYQSVYQLENTELHFQFEDILEDSRCPKTSTCAWPGRIRVNITITEGEKKANIELSKFGEGSDEGDTIATHDKYQIELIGVTPYPLTNRRKPFEDFTVILKITEL